MLALRRLYVMVLLSGNARPSHLKALNGIMAAFARMQVEVEAAERRRLAAAQELYKHKAQEHGTTVDAQAEEIEALKSLFPDYEDDFKDLEQRASDAAFEAALPPMPKDDDDDEEDKEDAKMAEAEEGKEGKATDDAETQRELRVDPELILQLVGYHQRLFGGGVLRRSALRTLSHRARVVS